LSLQSFNCCKKIYLRVNIIQQQLTVQF
jgi:hypothetical protein